MTVKEQPNSPAKKPSVIFVNVIILHSPASNVLHQYFSDKVPQSVSIYFIFSGKGGGKNPGTRNSRQI